MKKVLFSIILVSVFLTACNEDDNPETDPGTANLSIDLNGLEDLGTDYAYEGWIIVDGAPVSTGTFVVDASGRLSQTQFTVNRADLSEATQFVLTIEPVPDNDPAPSAVKYLAGDFNGDGAVITTGIVGDFSTSAGRFVFATPTSADTDDEFSGVWFLDPSSGAPAPALVLPELPEGWIYEGWAVVDGVPLSTGRFADVSGADDSGLFSGSDSSGPPFPGEDFIVNAPAGLQFPTDLRTQPIVITIEPQPDNSPAPFTLKPLFGTSPEEAEVLVPYDLNNQAADTFPWGEIQKLDN